MKIPTISVAFLATIIGSAEGFSFDGKRRGLPCGAAAPRSIGSGVTVTISPSPLYTSTEECKETDSVLATRTATRILTKEEVEYIINGAAFLGAGGGGPKEMANHMLDSALYPSDNDSDIDSKSIQMVNLSEVGDDEYVLISAYLGPPEEALKEGADMTYESLTTAKHVVQANGLELEDLKFVIPVEIGALNSIAPMVVAKDLGIPIVDADGAGRAVPTLSCLTFGKHENLLKKGFAVASDEFKDKCFCKVGNAGVAEKVAATIVESYGNLGALAIWLMKGKEFKENAIGGGLSRSLRIGEQMEILKKSAKTSDAFEPQAFCDKILTPMGLESKVIVSHGKIKRPYQKKSVNALDLTSITVEETDLETSNIRTVTVNALNENMFAYDSTKPAPIIMAPEMMCWLCADGSSIDNSELEKDDGTIESVHMIAVKPEKQMYDDKIVDAFMDIFRSAFGYAGSPVVLWPKE